MATGDIKATNHDLNNAFNGLSVKMLQLEAMLRVQSGDNTDGWDDMTQSYYREACLSMMLQARAEINNLDRLIDG